ncbi:hypothetical protein FQA47_019842, partial [Oryzias melastigma]
MKAGAKDDIIAGEECIIKGLCIYLDEDPENIYVKEVEWSINIFNISAEETM